MIKVNQEFDVVVLGGGLAGLTLTRQLQMAHPELRIGVIERREFPVNEAAHKVGESTVEIGAQYFAEDLKLKKHIVEKQLPKFGLRFFFKGAHQSLAEGTEVGGSEFFSAPSYQLDRGRFENFLAETVVKDGATLLTGKLRDVQLAEEGTEDPHRVVYVTGKTINETQSRWVVDASGRAGFLKRKLGIATDLGHDINAVWFRLNSEIQVDRWVQDDAWHALTGKVKRRWLSTNHLMGEGYWVWLIPLATGSTSVGIVADPRIHPISTMNRFDRALDWLKQHEPECASEVEKAQDKMQDFLALRKLSRGTKQVFSANRWALTGEAAAFLDPFYSPGSDFIAIGNTMIGKLIADDMAGRSLQHLAPTLQSVFLTLFQNNLLTYRDQYPLFGNPRIMALKFVWDYAVYWGFPALLFFNQKLTDVGFISSISKGIEEMREMNVRMQQFFRDWHQLDTSNDADPVFVNQNEIEVMTRMNAELREKLDDVALKNRFQENVAIVRDLMHEISSRIPRTRPRLQPLENTEPARNPQLCQIFESLGL